MLFRFVFRAVGRVQGPKSHLSYKGDVHLNYSDLCGIWNLSFGSRGPESLCERSESMAAWFSLVIYSSTAPVLPTELGQYAPT